jgi:CBS-domain-containing membrane protein
MAIVADIMTKDVIAVTLDTEFPELAKIFEEKRINGVPVVDSENTVIGVVCEADLVNHNKPLHIPTVFNILDTLIPLENPWRVHKDFKRIMATKVKDIYSYPAVTVEPETDIVEVAEIMSKHKFYTIPVVKDGKLVGVIGKTDVIRSLV